MYVSLTFNGKTPVRIVSAKPVDCKAHVGDRPAAKEAKLSQLGENIDPASNLGAQFAERVTVRCKS